jgi:aerobic carbon-monoxide dehydrogenase large subunit
MAAVKGQPLKRSEDARLLRGAAQFVDDIHLDDMLHAVVVRSLHAHARLLRVDASKARAAEGVALVLTGADLDGVVEPIGAIRREGMGEAPIPAHPVLAADRVCYLGQPIALVIASDRYTARDAADLVEVDYEPLAALVDPRASAAAPVPLHAHIGTNVVMRASAGAGDVAEAFENADLIVKGTYEIPRLVATPMECRGMVARYDPTADELTMWTSTQVPHRVKTYLTALLPQKPASVRVIAPDVGGGFGRKIEVWPEEVASAYAAIELKRPIKWIEERSENLVASHGRGFTGDVEAAVSSDGQILGLRFRMLADLGAFFLTSSGGPLGNAVQRVAGPYNVPAMDVECLGVVTNKPPTGPYRGAGGPEAAVLIERIVDDIAAELRMDPAALRKLNFIPADAFPHTTATGLTYDSGDFQTAFDRALELAEYDQVRKRQGSETPGDIVTGIGIATVVKASGGKAGVRQSNARIEIERTGHVVVVTDVSPHGQGTETSFAQITADALGVPIDNIEVKHGDTDLLENGGGTTSSRGLAVGGNAIYTALEQASESLRTTAGRMLNCGPDDVFLAENRAYSKLDFHAALDFEDVVRTNARQAGIAGPLVFEVAYTLPANPFAFAAHIAEVALDRATGDVQISRFVAVHDCGPMINPMIVRGQIQGGITQGIGQALSEGVGYDSTGQPFQTNLMTYGIPNSESTPAYVLENFQTPSPTNPLGIKGIGELPTVASPVAVANAIADALAQIGATAHGLDMPLTQERVWRAARG